MARSRTKASHAHHEVGPDRLVILGGWNKFTREGVPTVEMTSDGIDFDVDTIPSLPVADLYYPCIVGLSNGTLLVLGGENVCVYFMPFTEYYFCLRRKAYV